MNIGCGGVNYLCRTQVMPLELDMTLAGVLLQKNMVPTWVRKRTLLFSKEEMPSSLPSNPVTSSAIA